MIDSQKIKTLLLITVLMTFGLAQQSKAAIFDGTVTDQGVPYGICINHSDDPLCKGIDCNTDKDAVNPLCISEAQVGTGLAKTSLEGTGITHTDNFGDYIKKLVNFSLPYLVLAAFLGYVVAGFMYVTAFGSDDQINKAKKILIWVSAGLILVILSYAITNLLTGDLVKSLVGK